MHELGEEKERDKQTLRWACSAQNRDPSYDWSETMTQAKTNSQMPNQLSHPGVPKILEILKEDVPAGLKGTEVFQKRRAASGIPNFSRKEVH